MLSAKPMALPPLESWGSGQLKDQDTHRDSLNFLQEKAHKDARSPASFLPKEKALPSPAPGCPHGQDDTLPRSRGEQGSRSECWKG